MQGKEPGERPTTSVRTEAEKNKFDREAFGFFITPERRRELGGLSNTQLIDFNLFAEVWNEDVAETERNVLAGLLEPIQDPAKQINRKQAFDLANYWTESKKDVNTKRTVEKHQAEIQGVHRNNRIRLSTPATPGNAAVGATQGGDLFPFPLVEDGRDVRARPEPQLPSSDGAPFEQGGGFDIDSMLDVGQADGAVLGDGVDNIGETTAGASERRPIEGGASGEAREGSSTGDSGGGSGGVGGGGSGRAKAGDGAFVLPAVVCSTLNSVAPTFGTGRGLAAASQVWNPQLPMPPPARGTTKARSCQVCGHDSRMPRWTSSHRGGGRYGRKVCSVPDADRRAPDKPHNTRNRFDGPCTCDKCKPT